MIKTFTTSQNMKRLCAGVFALFTATSYFAQFTSGNVVVLQVSDGTATLSNTGNPIVLKEYSQSGTATFSVGVPTGTNNPMLISGSATSEGQLNLSANGKYLVFGGYAASFPNAAAIASSQSSVTNRAIGIVDGAGSYTRAAASASFHSGNNIRSATSDGNNNYWSAGANEGTDYFGTASPATPSIQIVNANTRHIADFGGNLYFTTSSGAATLQGIYRVSGGLAVTAGQTTSLIIGASNGSTVAPSPYGFYFNPAMTICYLADDRSIANGGGIQKWVNSAGTWTLAYTLTSGASSTVGCRSVIADFSGTNPKVFATTAESTADRLIAIDDQGAASTATTLATAGNNAIFRGVAFSPNCVMAVNSVTMCSGGQATLTATGAASYSWTSPSSNNSSITVSPTTNTTYVVMGTTAMGCVTSATANVSITNAPVVTVNSATACTGAPVTFSASGASTYTWSVGNATTAVITVTATSSTVYTVNATATGCGAVLTATAGLTVSTCTGIDELSVNNNISIYPNPANDKLVVNINGAATISVYSLTGQKVMSQQVNGNAALNVADLAKGVYFLKAEGSNKVVKFIKE